MAQSGEGIRVSPWWLIAALFVTEFGELCVSPVGLSLVTKLSPVRLVGLMMGVWFLSNSAGNKLAGWAAGFFGIGAADRDLRHRRGRHDRCLGGDVPAREAGAQDDGRRVVGRSRSTGDRSLPRAFW